MMAGMAYGVGQQPVFGVPIDIGFCDGRRGLCGGQQSVLNVVGWGCVPLLRCISGTLGAFRFAGCCCQPGHLLPCAW
jgi:hypothetical protein